jgi:hypothetical protein
MSEDYEFDSESEISNNYSHFGLKCNPFPLGGLATPDSPFVPISEKVTKQVVQFVNSVSGAKDWQGLAITGNIGTGKTRLLFSIETSIKNKLPFSNAIYVNKPSSNPIGFFSKIILLCDFNHLTNSIIQNNRPQLENIIKKNLIPRLDINGNKFFDIPNEIKLVNEINDFLSSDLKIDNNLRRAYSILIIGSILSEFIDEQNIEYEFDEFWISEMEDVKQFISGKEIPSKKLKSLEISDLVVTEDTMETSIFPAFLKFNQIGGKKIVYALIDEFQFIADLKANQKIVNILNMIIAVSQTNSKGFCMILSCKPESWNFACRISDSFQDRFKNEIALPNLTKKVALKLIYKYLELERIKKIPETEEIKPEQIYPFNDDAINKILEKTRYNVRNFLIHSGFILDEAIKSKKKVIDIEFVSNYFRGKIKGETISLW